MNVLILGDKVDFFDENEENLDLDIYNSNKAESISLIDGFVDFKDGRVLNEVLESLIDSSICKIATNGSLKWNLNDSNNGENVYIDDTCIILPQLEHMDDLIDDINLLIDKSSEYIVKIVKVSSDDFLIFHSENGETITEIYDLISLIKFFEMNEEDYFTDEEKQSDIMYDKIMLWFEDEEDEK